ncbi:MAG: DUF805 domain-containing protein [Patescibacteria group bacterium]|nr:DUF805 domain-containing protein [Patescibacteria group bacterium]MCL5431624.1 DUF805 domain-containing protein [Patescibacteria group bacterium]
MGNISIFVLYFLVIIADAFWRGLTNQPGEYQVSIWASIIGYTGLIMYGLSISIRRLHDLGKSGWYLLINLIPVANIIMAFVLWLMPGSKTENQYGLPPLAGLSLKAVFGFIDQ